MENSNLEYARLAVKTLDEKMAEDIKVIDISEVSAFADYFILATGKNINHVQVLADEVEEALGRAYHKGITKEGYETANWILLDAGDIIVHVFDKESRNLYDLERIWRDGKNLDVLS